ncbi:MAG: glutathione S-transferase family protein [Pseudomonadota bacterium]
MTDTPQILLHNYPQSPVAEKVRIAFGIKGLGWASVEIPRLAPKPMLTALTGGYRRTPVMQIGADIYCDSLCIIEELERRFPDPSFFPGATRGLATAIARWTDGALFAAWVKLILAGQGENLPADFAADRGRLYLGPDWAEALERAQSDLPHMAAQARQALSLLDDMLAGDQAHALGAAPSLADLAFWHVVWFLRGRWEGGPPLIAEFPAIEAWEARMAAIGHGPRSDDVDPADAIAIAAAAEPTAPEGTDPRDPQGLTPGMAVTVVPDTDGGEQPGEGILRYASRDRIVILRDSAEAGRLAVHYPRAGYRVRPL